MGLITSVNSAIYNSFNNLLARQDMNITRSSNRLSTGYRVNGARDGAYEVSISTSMKSQLSGVAQVIQNLEQNIEWCQGRDRGLQAQSETLVDAKAVAVRAANDATLTTDDINTLNGLLNNALNTFDDIGSEFKTLGHKSLYDPGMLDVLWVVDQTGSMTPYIDSLKSDAANMYASFSAKGFDLNMAAVGFETNLSGNGSAVFADNDTDFVSDLDDIVSNLFGATERGMTSVQQAVAGIGSTMRADARKVIILLTDEDSDDFGGLPDAGLTAGAAAEAFRQATADALIAADAGFYAVGENKGVTNPTPPPFSITVPMPDQDYQDVVVKVGNGINVNLDAGGAWVSPVVNTLQAEGGPWDSTFQCGINTIDNLTITFNSVSTGSMGASGLSIANAAAAQAAIDSIDEAIANLGDELSQIAALELSFQSLLDRHMSEYASLAAASSVIRDTDFAREITNLVASQLVAQFTVSIMSQAGTLNRNTIMSILSSAT